VLAVPVLLGAAVQAAVVRQPARVVPVDPASTIYSQRVLQSAPAVQAAVEPVILLVPLPGQVPLLVFTVVAAVAVAVGPQQVTAAMALRARSL
jgi:hypothetical protein